MAASETSGQYSAYCNIILLVFFNDYLYFLIESLGLESLYSLLLQFTDETYFASSLILLAVSLISIRDYRYILPFEGYGIFIVTKLGLKIATRALHES